VFAIAYNNIKEDIYPAAVFDYY